MKNVTKNERTHALMKAGLALLLGGSVACGEVPTSYSQFVEEGPNVWAVAAERQLEDIPQLSLDAGTGDERLLASELVGDASKLHSGIVSPKIGQAHFKESTTEKDRGIPEEYPDLLGDESAAFQVQLGTKTMRLTAHDLSFDSISDGESFMLEVESVHSDAVLGLSTLRLDPSQQVGAGKDPNPAFKLRLGETIWSNRSNGQCYPSVVLDIDGKSELALWGRLKGTLCDGSVEREFAGTFAALKPGIRALQ